MADGARPQTSVPLPSGLIAGLGDAATAVKTARKEIKALKREIAEAVKSGAPMFGLTRRLDQAQKLEASLMMQIKQQRVLSEGIKRTRTDAIALKWVLGTQAFRQFIQGGLPDIRNLGYITFAAAEPIAAVAKKHLGPASRIAKFASQYASVAMFFAEAVQSTLEAIERIKADQAEFKEFAQKVASGEYGVSEQRLHDMIIDENHNLFGGDPKAQFETIMQLANKIANADEKTFERIIKPTVEREFERTNTTRPWSKERWDSIFFRWENWQNAWALEKFQGNKLEAMFERAIERKRDELGFTEVGLDLSEEQKKIVRSQEIYGIIKNLSEAERKKLLEQINKALKDAGKAFDNRFKNLAQLQREASEKFRETEEKKIRELRFQRARHRVALNGRIGD